MTDIVVAVFPDERKAADVARLLDNSHAGAENIPVLGLAVLTKREDGTLVEEQWSDRLPLRAPVGALVGALIGLPAGMLGSAIGFVSGAWIGLAQDLKRVGISEGLLSNVAAKLGGRNSALIIEVPKSASERLQSWLRERGAVVVQESLKPAAESPA